MDQAHIEWLTRHLQTKDATLFLDEMQDKLIEEFNKRYSISTICVNLINVKISRKKLSKIAIRQNEYLRHQWRLAVDDIETSRFIFLDETRKDPRTLRRNYGRGRRGARVHHYAEFTRSQRGYSALCFMTMDGIVASSITKRSGVDSQRFRDDIRHCLFPLLKPDSIVVLDNGAFIWSILIHWFF